MFSSLVATCSPVDVLRDDPALLVTDQVERAVDRDMAWLEQPGHYLVALHDEAYPPLLREIPDPPPLLFADGDISVLAAPDKLAMVGARKASGYGLARARDIAADLAANGVVVVSGLALGIDTAAHEGALSAAGGESIAVLGTGCDVIYPKRNWRLAGRIRQRGVVLSEFPLGCQPFPGNFPRRNRIVTGLSRATLVVEAARRSGSLVSAGLAMSQGRDVLALPGQVTHAAARGCHQLIREGAALIEGADDVLRELGLDECNLGILPSRPRLSPDQQTLCDCLESGPLSADLLCEMTGLAIDELTVALVSLEIAGMVDSEAGLYRLRHAV